MNRLFSLRNPVGVIGAVAAFVFSLSACGDDSGNSSYNANDFSLQVESMGELPNCSKNRSGDIAEVLGERKAYVCDNGRWEFDHDILDSVETEDDLPVSTANGKSVKRKNPKVLQRQRKLHRVAAKNKKFLHQA